MIDSFLLVIASSLSHFWMIFSLKVGEALKNNYQSRVCNWHLCLPSHLFSHFTITLSSILPFYQSVSIQGQRGIKKQLPAEFAIGTCACQSSLLLFSKLQHDVLEFINFSKILKSGIYCSYVAYFPNFKKGAIIACYVREFSEDAHLLRKSTQRRKSTGTCGERRKKTCSDLGCSDFL